MKKAEEYIAANTPDQGQEGEGAKTAVGAQATGPIGGNARCLCRV